MINIKPIKSNLTNAKSEKIDLREGGGTGFGFSFKYSNKNGIEQNLNFITIKKQSQIDDKKKIVLPIKGSVKYSVNYTINYDKVELSKNDIGKHFTLNQHEYILENVKNNIIFLRTKNKNTKSEIKIINFDKNPENVLVEKPLNELNDINGNDIIALGTVKSSITKKIFDFFTQNPDTSLENFKKHFTLEELMEKGKVEEYLIISIPIPIINKFILYSPILYTNEIEVNM